MEGRYFDGKQRGKEAAFGGGEARAAAVQELRFSGWGGFQGGVLQAGPRVLSE